MKKIVRPKTLKLATETLRIIASERLANAAGGWRSGGPTNCTAASCGCEE